ncbi:hypothetical protein AML91_05795 [Paenibacillus jilunlii]|uniref:Uncharacterized protein n=1 Tax=Paenibacillus jilunlii TaxID=682956 RepID=A0ABR5T036_9BACL|nr:hypothetical protein AML91_05795 [Paenibacillus jilunlii]
MLEKERWGFKFTFSTIAGFRSLPKAAWAGITWRAIHFCETSADEIFGIYWIGEHTNTAASGGVFFDTVILMKRIVIERRRGMQEYEKSISKHYSKFCACYFNCP